MIFGLGDNGHSVNYESGSKAMPLTEIPCHVEITFLALKEVLVVVVQDDHVHFEVHKPSYKAGVVCPQLKTR